jgi:hypothetical protein
MPDDKDDYEIYTHAMKMYMLIGDLQQELRSKCKHGEPTEQDEHWKKRLYELMTEHEITLEF